MKPARILRPCAVLLFLLMNPSLIPAQQVDLWQGTGGPEGALFPSLFQSPDGDGTVFVRTFSSSNPLFRSDDGGATWVPAFNGLPPVDFGGEFAACGDGELVFARVPGFGEREVEVFRSTNSGAGWSRVAAAGPAVEASSVSSMACLPDRELLMVAGTFVAPNFTQRVYRSTDEGTSWSLQHTLPPNGGAKLAVTPDGTALIGQLDGAPIHRSIDGGVTWNETPGSRMVAAFGFSNGTAFAGGLQGLFRSTDDGATWNAANTGLPADVPVWAITGSDGGSVFVAASTFEGAKIGPDNNGIFKSIDDGSTWAPAGQPFPSFPDRAYQGLFLDAGMAYTAEGGLLVSNFSGGVRRSTDMGDSWAASNHGLHAGEPGTPRFAPDGALFVNPTPPDPGMGLARSTDHGMSWEVTEIAFANSHGMSFGEGGRAFLTTGPASPRRSDDSGATWSEAAPVPPAPGFAFSPFSISSLITPAGSVVLGTDQGIFRSTDNGDSWTHSSAGISVGEYAMVQTMVVTPGGALLATVDGENVIRIHRSTDDGVTWTPVGFIVFVGQITVAPNGSIFAATFGDGVCRSTDDGVTWEAKNNGLPSPEVSSVAALADGTLLAVDSFDGTISMSTDNAESWSPYTPAFPGAPFPLDEQIPFSRPDKLVAGPDDHLFMSTFGNGLVRGVSDFVVNLFLPQFATGTIEVADGLRAGEIHDGGKGAVAVANKTRLILINNGDATDRGVIRFRDETGALSPVAIGGKLVSELPYVIPPHGTLDFVTDGTGDLQTGVIEVVSERGETSLLEGTEAFDLLGKFVSVSNSPPESNLEVYVSQVADEKTGVALYNPNPENSITIELVLYDNLGVEKARKEIVLTARNQLVRFVDQEALFKDYFDANPGDFSGTLSVNGKDAAEFSGFGILQDQTSFALIAVSTDAGGDPGRLLFTQFVNGTFLEQPNKTRLILLTTDPDEGTVGFQDAAGTAVSVPVGGMPTQQLDYDLPARGTAELTTDGTGDFQTGVIEVNSDDPDNSTIGGTEVFEILGNFVSVSSAPPRSANQAYVSFTNAENTGVAIYNPDDSMQITLTFVLVDAGGRERARREVTLDPRAQLVQFVDQDQLFKDFFDANPGSFAGTLNIFVADDKKAAVLGLLQDRGTGALIAVKTSPNAFDPGA